MLSYNNLIAGIYMAPMTWIPDIIIKAVESGYAKGCFLPGGAGRFVSHMEQRILKEKGGSGSNVTQQAQPKIITLHCGKCTSRFTLTENNIHRRCGFNGCDGVLHKIS